MAEFGYPDLTIELDDDGGTLQDISSFVTSINGWTKEQIIEELTGAGDDTDRWAAIGFEMKQPVTLTGPYDDTSDGLVDLTKGAGGATRTLQLTFDGATAADVETVECIIQTISRNPSRGALTAYEVTLRPTGAIT